MHWVIRVKDCCHCCCCCYCNCCAASVIFLLLFYLSSLHQNIHLPPAFVGMSCEWRVILTLITLPCAQADNIAELKGVGMKTNMRTIKSVTKSTNQHHYEIFAYAKRNFCKNLNCCAISNRKNYDNRQIRADGGRNFFASEIKILLPWYEIADVFAQFVTFLAKIAFWVVTFVKWYKYLFKRQKAVADRKLWHQLAHTIDSDTKQSWMDSAWAFVLDTSELYVHQNEINYRLDQKRRKNVHTHIKSE